MHVPDGFLNAPTSIATGGISAAVVGLALHRSRRELADAGPVRAGLTACFIFAAQMVNFPVAAGTSGHLLGGALAVALVGPWTAVLVMACVLIVQAFVFADGGVTALGTNILLMGIVTVAVATGVSALVMRLAGGRRTAVPVAAGLAAFVSVPVAAAGFALLYLIGGAAPIPAGMLAGAMVGTHLLIGIGEALITAAVVAAVLARRPDLVRLAGVAGATPQATTAADGSVVLDPAAARATGTSASSGIGRRTLAVVLGVSAVVAGGISLLASSSPDGLERVAGALGFESAAADSPMAGSPLADYGIAGLGALGTTIAGLVGAAITLGVGLLVARLIRPRSVAAAPAESTTAH